MFRNQTPTCVYKCRRMSAIRPFVDRAAMRQVLGKMLSVASIEDVLQGKIWAASDPTRRSSKRLKDLSDIARILEVRPDLIDRVPDEIRQRL